MAFDDGVADFRSDTVTRPTAAMRSAMAEAAVGDDVFGDDPTVNRLEEESASMLGKEAAVFVPSGTMGNQLAVAVHTERGQDVLCPRDAHLRYAERGAASAWSGVSLRPVGDERGLIRAEEVESAVEAARSYVPPFPPIALLTWENTHNFSGGSIVQMDPMEETVAAARRIGLAVHLDGARLWNSVAATGIPAERYAAAADSVMFCFSKGLGAPVGSVLCGNAQFVAEARAWRKRMGGGMRQVGVLAAPALIALAERERLVEDHHTARRLAEGIAQRYPGAVDLEGVQTNMVLVTEAALPHPPGTFLDALERAAVLATPVAPGILRFVTHRDVDLDDVGRVLEVLDRL